MHSADPEPAQHHGKEFALAQELFRWMCDPEDSHVPMTHDGYFKIWQLSDHNMGAGVAPQCPWHGDSMVRRPRPFGQQRAYCCCSECNYQHPPGNDYILVDEAQDLTPCQADVLFHQHKSHGA